MSRANGMVGNSGLVFNTSLYPNGGGGLGGGGLGGGDPTAGILWHEFAGHGMGLPHAGTDANYPYQSTSSTYTDNVWSVLEDGTVYSADGGIGPNWGYDQITGEYLPNFYYPKGELKLASDPMWGGAGKQPDGYAFQMFSDYYNLKIYDFVERQLEWRPNAVEGQDTEDGGFAGEGYFELWDTSTEEWVTLTDANYKTLNSKLVEDDLAHVIDTPVYFISGYITQPDGSKPVIGGEYHPGIELIPIQTTGNLVAPFADILTGAGRSDREGDYVMRVTYATDLGLLTEHLIIPSNYDMRYFGVNIADKGELVRVDIVEAGDANTAAYLQNKVIGSYVNSDALANTVFKNDDRFTLGDESIVLPKYWNGSKVTWSTTVDGLVDLETGVVDASKLGPQSAIKAQWVEQGVYKEQSFVLDLPAPEQVFVQLFGTLSSDESLLYGPLDLPDTLGEARVTWSSSDTGVLNSDGSLGGTNGQVSLTAEVTYPNGATQRFSKAYQAVPADSAAGGLNLWIIETLPDEDPDPADDGGYTIADMRNLLETGILTTKTPIYSEQWSEIWWWRKESGFSEFGTDFKDNVLVGATGTDFRQALTESLWVMSGFLKPSETGEHQIGFKADDAGLMFIEVDGQLISLSSQNQRSWSTALDLESGKLYPIWYFAKTTSADPDNNAAYWDTIQTLWRTPSNPAPSDPESDDWLIANTIPAENFVPMPLDPSKPYPAAWLPPAAAALVTEFSENRLEGDEVFVTLTPADTSVLSGGEIYSGEMQSYLVAGTKVHESFDVPAEFSDPDMQFWVRLVVNDSAGHLIETDPLEPWQVSVVGSRMTLTGTIDRGADIEVQGIKVYADDLMNDDVAAAELMLSVSTSTPIDSFDTRLQGIDFNRDGDILDLDEAYSMSDTLAGTDNSGANEAKLVIDVDELSTGDVLEVHLDGVLALTHSLTDIDVQAGEFSSSQVDFASYDIENDQQVELNLKVKQNGEYVQADSDVVWEYQW